MELDYLDRFDEWLKQVKRSGDVILFTNILSMSKDIEKSFTKYKEFTASPEYNQILQDAIKEYRRAIKSMDNDLQNDDNTWDISERENLEYKRKSLKLLEDEQKKLSK